MQNIFIDFFFLSEKKIVLILFFKNYSSAIYQILPTRSSIWIDTKISTFDFFACSTGSYSPHYVEMTKVNWRLRKYWKNR